MAGRVPTIHEVPKKPSILYLKKAKKACIDNNYAEAYENFVLYFESLNDPSEATEAVQTVFTRIVSRIGHVLEEVGNIEELLKCYVQAINLFPQNYTILTNLGAYMFRIGEVDIAKRYLELAVKAGKNYLPAEKNLMYLKWQQVPRWHFRMLNDRIRNEAYLRAISTIMAQGYKNVADIGAGCGFLSLLASRDTEARIVAYEENKTLYRICCEVLRENDANNVRLENCYSTDVEEPSAKCDLIVTEIFDVALFGERALESILHALTHIRTENDFKIIPSAATVYVTGINCKELYMKNHVVNKDILKMFNMEKECIRAVNDEPYDAEDFTRYYINYLTDVQVVFNINFSDVNQMSTLVNDENYGAILNLKCRKGTIHAFAVWFDLNLMENLRITTSPFEEDRCKCWEQAVFHLEHPLDVDEGEVLVVKATVADCKLKFDVINKGRDDDDKGHHQCWKVSKDIIGFLNDKDLCNTIVDFVQKVTNDNLMVRDSNAFPLMAFLMSKNSNCTTVLHEVKTNTELNRNFFEKILSINKIQSKWCMLESTSRLLNDAAMFKPNLHFFEIISPDGLLDNSAMKKLLETKNAVAMPKTVKIEAQLIESNYLNYCNRVDDGNLMGFKIGKFINEYTGHEHPNLEEFESKALSRCFLFNLADGKQSQEITATTNGTVNAIQYWYHLELFKNINYCTLDSPYYKTCCFLLDKPRVVTEGEKLQIDLYADCSYLKFFIQ